MKKLLLLLLFFISFMGAIVAQNNYSFTGKVTDENNQPLSDINVIADGGKVYDITDAKGNFELSLTKGFHEIEVKALGFQTIRTSITLNGPLRKNFVVKASFEGLDEVVVEADTKEEKVEAQAITIENISIDQVESKINVITDEIEKVSGVRVRRSGSLGDNAQVTLNGLSGNAVRFFVDGIPFEFLYPGQNIANVPIADIEDVEIYKGVLPSELSADALGGGINLVTKRKDSDKLKVSYSFGSFNTHRGSVYANIADKKSNFINFVAGIDYSDNDYTFVAPAAIANPFVNDQTGSSLIQIGNFRVRRFHDRYRQQYSGITIGTYSKKWADEVSIRINYQNSFKEVNNSFDINDIAVGEAEDSRENVALIAKYKKALFNNHWKISATASYSEEMQTFKDTSRNIYNWLGQVIGRRSVRGGEFSPGDFALSDNDTKNISSRISSELNITKHHYLIHSLIYNNQKRERIIVNNVRGQIDLPDQEIDKLIGAMEFRGDMFNKTLDYFAGGKFYHYKASLAGDNNNALFNVDGDFGGWFAGLKYKPFRNLTLRGSYERAFLIPTIFQLAGNFPNLDPNPELEPEESDNINVGLVFKKRFRNNFKFKSRISGYYRFRRDELFIRVESSTQRYVNIFDTKTRGIEGDFEFHLFDKFKLKADVTLQEKILDALNEKVVDDNDTFNVGLPIPNTPNFFYNVELTYTPKPIFNKKVKTSFYSLLNYTDTFNFLFLGGSDTEENNPSRFIFEQYRWDAGFSVKLLKQNITAAFNVRNITNEALFDNFGIPRASRSFDVKLIYQLNKF